MRGFYNYKEKILNPDQQQTTQEEKPSFRLTGHTVGHIAADEAKEIDETTKSIMKSAWVSGKMKKGMMKEVEKPSSAVPFDAILETAKEEKARIKQSKDNQRLAGWASLQRKMQVDPPTKIDESLDFNPAEKYGGSGAMPARKRWGNFEPREQPRQPLQQPKQPIMQQVPMKSRHSVPEGIGFKGAAVATKSRVGVLPKANIEEVKKAAQEAAAQETDEPSDSSSSSIDEIEAEKMGLHNEASDSEEDEDEIKPLFSKRFGYILPDGTTVKTKEMEQEEEKQKEKSIGRRAKYVNPIPLTRADDDLDDGANGGEVVRRRATRDNKPKAVVGEAAKIMEEELKKKEEEEKEKLRKLDAYKKQVEMERLRRKKEKEEAKRRGSKKSSKSASKTSEWNNLDINLNPINPPPQEQQPQQTPEAEQQQQQQQPPQPQEPDPNHFYQPQIQPMQQQFYGQPPPVQQQFYGQQPIQVVYGQPPPMQNQGFQEPAPQKASGLSRWLKNNKTAAELEQQSQPAQPVQPAAQPMMQQVIIQPQIAQNGQAIPPIMITPQTLIQLLAVGVQPPQFSNIDPDDIDEIVVKKERPEKVNRADIRRRAIRTLEAPPPMADQVQIFKEEEAFYEEEVVYEEEDDDDDDEEEE